MTYTINDLAKLAGISTRTLRYYDQIGLLEPAREPVNGYRIYGQKEINKLQQILFYRELGVPLDDIQKILSAKDFDALVSLESHLTALYARRAQLDLLIANVKKTISAQKGDIIMKDIEKFDGFIQKLVEDNERQYGKEIRSKYGDEAIDRSNTKVRDMMPAQYDKAENLSRMINETLRAAFEQGDPSSPIAQKACALHKEWLCCYWDSYSKEAHVAVTQMYVDDPRFTAYYNKIADGCAAFLRDAVLIYCQ